LGICHTEGHRSLLRESYTDVILLHSGLDRESE